jgi:AcrR family transcriptional regulator
MNINLTLKNRVLSSASELFYNHGIRAVGVDEVAKHASTTKAGIYRNFESKDHLVAEWLKQQNDQHRDWWLSIYTKHPSDPLKQLKEIIHGVSHALLHSSRGCPLTNSSVELTDDDHIARSVVLEHKAWIRNELKSLCKQAKLPSHSALAEILFLLMEGAKISTNSFESKGPAKNLASSANALIEAYQQSQK